jgi:N12 class adenine-specific DNA methylase/phospholipid N-methyltransferase
VPFTFLDAGALDDLGGAAARYTKNIAALQLLRKVLAAGRTPETLTYAEQLTLAQYTAFADSEVLNRAFVDAAKTGETTGERFSANESIAELVSEAAQATMRRTALTAFYTPLQVIEAIWEQINDMHDGTSRLRILEPSAGVGNFLSMMPPALRENAEITAVELDITSAEILALLHPDVRLFGGQGFETVTLPEKYFDIAISNIPFSDVGVTDPTMDRELTRTLHDYFFAKTLHLVRPGGVIVFLTSYGTLDKAGQRVRNWLSERADLLAAIRLPHGVFSANAGTMSGSDVLIVQRRADDAGPGKPWPHSEWTILPQTADRAGLTTGSRYAKSDGPAGAARVSLHFIQHPEDVIGSLFVVSKSGSTWLYVAPPNDEPIASVLARRLARISAKLPAPAQEGQRRRGDGNALSRALDDLEGHTDPRVRGMLDIYRAAKRVIQLEIDGTPDEELAQIRQELNTIYLRFVGQYGILNAQANRRVLKDMPELAFLLALETNVRQKKGGVTAQRAAIFRHATARPARATTDKLSPQDALIVSLDERGRVDMDLIAARATMDKQEAIEALRGLVYRVPDGLVERYETADQYLSGNIRIKLRAAQGMAALDPSYQAHVTALEAVLPTPLRPGEIIANLGASWIGAEDVDDFIRLLIPAFNGRVRYHTPLARWEVMSDGYTRASVPATTTWGTQRMDAIEIIDESLNGRQVRVYDVWEEYGVEKRAVNEPETLAAQDKQNLIKDRFRQWAWEEPTRSARLAAAYNERYNSVRLREYDGSHLALPGINGTKLRGGDLARWQKDAVWQGLQNQTTLIGHVVGAGKTFELLAIAHEARRMGLAAKPMVIVPNHLIEQWAAEAQRLYPGMQVLAMGPEDFGKERRGIFLSKIATGSWDLIIVAHTSFKLLPMGPEPTRTFVNQRLYVLRQFLEEVKNDNGTRRSLKEIEKRIAKLELRLANAEAAITHDDERTITWEELGIDLLMVDEAHEFKNLQIETRMDRVAGVPNGGSQRAFDLWMKTWDLIRRGGKVIFATGTPVANTLAEVFVMMRYLQNDLLESLGIDQFDAWAATFAQTQTGLELRPDGSGFRMNTRLTSFVNLPELATLWRQCLNVRTAEQLNLPRPRLATGRVIPVVIPPSQRLKDFVQELVRRVEKIKNREVDPWVDNMLLITSEGRRAALDLRMVLKGPEEPICKINALVENVARIYKESSDHHGGQLVFCDLSTPKGGYVPPSPEDPEAEAADDASESEQMQRGFVYHEIRQKLVARGIPYDEIAFIHEHGTKVRREALFEDMRAGRVRVLLGSTAKMGTGMNVQDRLIALHHMDAPWRPCDIEQREGRILRQGNRWDEVQIYQYIAEGSFDSYLWQLLENKARFISQVMAGEITQRTAEDVAEVVLSAAEIKALASGNPKVLQRVQLDSELSRLERVRSVWLSDHRSSLNEIDRLTERMEYRAQDIALLDTAIALRNEHRKFVITLIPPKGKPVTYKERAGATEALRLVIEAWMKQERSEVQQGRAITRRIGTYQGLHLDLHLGLGASDVAIAIDREHGRPHTFASAWGNTDTGLLASIDYHIRSLDKLRERQLEQVAEMQQRRADLTASTAKPWDGLATHQRVLEQLARLDAEMNGETLPPADPEQDDALSGLLAEARTLISQGAPPPPPTPQAATFTEDVPGTTPTRARHEEPARRPIAVQQLSLF